MDTFFDVIAVIIVTTLTIAVIVIVTGLCVSVVKDIKNK